MEDRYVLLSIQYEYRLVYMGAAVDGGRLDLIYCERICNMLFPVGVPLVALYMQPPRVYKCTNGLCIRVAVLGLQSAPFIRVQRAPVTVLGESTRSGLGFSWLDPAGDSASWVYLDCYSPITLLNIASSLLDRSIMF